MPTYIFIGEDDFSLRRKIENWKREFIKKYSQESIVVLERGERGEDEIIRQLEQALSPSLFASQKLILAKDYIPSKAAEAKLGEFLLSKIEVVPKDFFLVLWQSSKPDRRLSAVKKIINSDKVIVTSFELPHGRMLDAWIKAFAKTLDLTLDDQAIDELARYLGRDFYEEKKFGGKVVERKEMFDLWQAQSELQKLASFTKHADLAAVRALVKPKVPENVFALADELVKKNAKNSLEIAERLLANPSSDEKSAAIKLLGLLAEQVRGMLLVKVLREEGKGDAEISDDLGWSTGRVYILSKNASAQTAASLKKMVTLLTNIDSKLKSLDENPRLLLDQFILAACQ